MNKNQVIINSIVSTASLLVSLVFLAYGIAIMLSKDIQILLFVFGAAVAAYGLFSVVILFMAWRRFGVRAKKITTYITVGFMVLYFLGSLDVGIISGLEIVGLIVVGLLLFINWLAVSMVVKYKNIA